MRKVDKPLVFQVMQKNVHDSKEYQGHARKCLRIAVSTQNPAQKKQFEEMAATWMILAEGCLKR
jgi:hypothetical protein